MNAVFEQAHFGPAYKLWVKDVNDAGGLNVAGKKLPIEMKVVDDQSDLDTSLRLQTQLMEQDKVDFMFAPCSTAFLFASAGLQNDHKYIFLSAEGGATTLSKQMEAGKLPWVFQFLNYSDHNQMPVMAELMPELGMKTFAIMYIDDLHGIEYNAQAQIFFGTPPLSAKMTSTTAVPPGIKDVSSIIKKIQAEKPDLVCSFQYPPENILTYQTMMQLNYNPPALLGGPGTSTQAIYDIFKGGLDGIFFEGAWTPKQSPDDPGLLHEQARSLCRGHGERRLLGRADLQGRARVLPAGHRRGRDPRSGQDRRRHAQGALQDDHVRRYLPEPGPDPRQLVLCRPDRPVAERLPRGRRQGQTHDGQALVSETDLGGCCQVGYEQHHLGSRLRFVGERAAAVELSGAPGARMPPPVPPYRRRSLTKDIGWLQSGTSSSQGCYSEASTRWSPSG